MGESRRPGAGVLVSLLGVSLALAFLGWTQVRSYREGAMRFEESERRIEAELPSGAGGAGPASMPVEESLVIRFGERSWPLPSSADDPVLEEIEAVLRRAIEDDGLASVKVAIGGGGGVRDTAVLGVLMDRLSGLDVPVDFVFDPGSTLSQSEPSR